MGAKDTQQNKPQSAMTTGEADDSRSMWTFQTQNLTNSCGTSRPVKYPSSIGSVTLAVLYLDEALLLLGKVAEARTLLAGFVVADALTRGLVLQSRVPGANAPGNSNTENNGSGFQLGSSIGCLTSPTCLSAMSGAILQPEGGSTNDAYKDSRGNTKSCDGNVLVTYPGSEFPSLGNTQCVLYTNLAALHAQDGNLVEAERCCEKALQFQPSALSPLHTLTYVLLRRGQPDQALQCLKHGRLGSNAS